MQSDSESECLLHKLVFHCRLFKSSKLNQCRMLCTRSRMATSKTGNTDGGCHDMSHSL